MLIEKLRLLCAQIKSMLGAFTLSQRVMFFTGALLVAISLSCLLSFVGSSNQEVLLRLNELDSAEQELLLASLDEQDVDWELEGEAVMIKKGRRSELIMKLKLDKKLPVGKDPFNWIFNTGPTNTPTPKVFDERVRLSRGRKLALLIQAMSFE